MQPARIKPHAKEHTNNPVQRPNLRGHANTKREGRVVDLHRLPGFSSLIAEFYLVDRGLLYYGGMNDRSMANS